MNTIAISRFKERCLALLDRLGPEGLVITKHGRPIARVIPIGTEGRDLIGSLKQKITIKGEILSTGVRWDAQP